MQTNESTYSAHSLLVCIYLFALFSVSFLNKNLGLIAGSGSAYVVVRSILFV